MSRDIMLDPRGGPLSIAIAIDNGAPGNYELSLRALSGSGQSLQWRGLIEPRARHAYDIPVDFPRHFTVDLVASVEARDAGQPCIVILSVQQNGSTVGSVADSGIIGRRTMRLTLRAHPRVGEGGGPIVRDMVPATAPSGAAPPPAAAPSRAAPRPAAAAPRAAPRPAAALPRAAASRDEPPPPPPMREGARAGRRLLRKARKRGPMKKAVKRGAKKRGGGGGGRLTRSRSARRMMSAAPPQPTEARREPHIDFHEWVRAGDKQKLVVRLADIVGPVEAGGVVSIPIPRGKKSVEIIVSLSAPGFDIAPRPDQRMKVGRDFDARREQVTYQLTAREPGPKPVTKEIRADFKMGNRRIGAVMHYTTVAPKNYKQMVRGDGRSRTEPFAMVEAPQSCELEISVFGKNDPGKPPFQIRLDSTIPGESYRAKAAGELEFPVVKVTRYLQDIFDGFTAKYKKLKDASEIRKWRKDLVLAIDALGKNLWDRMPQQFKDEYFRLHKLRKLPKSIQIHSDEMVIPWELMIPYSGGTTLKPLGIAHVMGRWRPGLGIKPTDQRLAIRNGVILNPKYPSSDALWWSVKEAQDLKALVPSLQEVRPANARSLRDVVKRTDVQLLHYTGHGEFSARNPDLSTLVLETQDKFAAVSLAGAKLLAKANPILYLNACGIGSTGVVLGQMGGFAEKCVMGGCSGIIAPYWSISDDSARKFALALYEKILAGASIGKALQELRASNRKDPTFQAFAYFGDPLTRARFAAAG